MKSVHKSVLIWYSPAQMCDLVKDVPQYPQFLPWCSSGTLHAPDADGSYIAEVGMRFASINQAFATRNRLDYPLRLHMDLESGPFRKLHGTWQFLPIAGDAQACRIELDLSYDFNPLLSAVVGPVFDKIANTMVESFIERAEQVYG
jgi:ribosome-associated toxin RatA of RatAB toxin-antitoxin module